MGETISVSRVQRSFFKEAPGSAARAVLVGIVCREQQALGADNPQTAKEIGMAPHAAAGDVQISAGVLEERVLEL